VGCIDTGERYESGTVNLIICLFSGYSTGKMLKPLIICRNKTGKARVCIRALVIRYELEGTRRRGRPRKRWKDEVERNLPVLGMRRWRELVADSKKWKDIVRQGKAHSGL